MEIVNNLPVILAAFTAFLAGVYGYLNKLPNIRVYQNMSLFLVVFYIIGTLVKRTVKSIWEEHQEKSALAMTGDLALEDLQSGEANIDNVNHSGGVGASGSVNGVDGAAGVNSAAGVDGAAGVNAADTENIAGAAGVNAADVNGVTEGAEAADTENIAGAAGGAAITANTPGAVDSTGIASAAGAIGINMDNYGADDAGEA